MSLVQQLICGFRPYSAQHQTHLFHGYYIRVGGYFLQQAVAWFYSIYNDPHLLALSSIVLFFYMYLWQELYHFASIQQLFSC